MDNDDLKQEFLKTIETTRELLAQNVEWIERYKEYAEKINEKLPLITQIREGFNEWKPLAVYLTTGNAKDTTKNKVLFDVRYLGQTVAKLSGFINNKYTISTSSRLNETNKKNFGCAIELKNKDWNSIESSNFQNFFTNMPKRQNINKRNEEHRLESLWLEELNKTKNQKLKTMTAVKLAETRYPMPTPLGAANPKNIKYSGPWGGGIDILAKYGVEKDLCIIELKSIASETPHKVLKQGIAYATFIRELLRSESGKLWWKLFGYNELPKKLTLYVAGFIPSSKHNKDTFKDMELDIDGDTLKLHYLYFTEKDNELEIVESSFT